MFNDILKVVIVAKENNKDNVIKTYNNITNDKENNIGLIAMKKGESSELKQYCIENKIEFYEYESIKDIFVDLAYKTDSEYITFVNEGDIFSDNLLQRFQNNINKESETEKIYICNVRYENEQYLLSKYISKNEDINIELFPQKIWIHIEGCFIKTDLIKLAVQEKCIFPIENEKDIITKLIVLNGGYKTIKKIRLKLINKLEDDEQPKEEYYDKNWYFKIFDEASNLLKFSKKYFNTNLIYIQYSILYRIKQRINSNVNMKDKHIIKGELLKEFLEKLKNILKEMDDKIIRDTLGNRSINYWLLKLKYNKDSSVEYKEFLNNICIYNNNLLIFDAKSVKMKVLLIDYEDGVLKITANYPLPFDEEKFKVVAEYNGKQYKATKNYLYSDYKVFGETIYNNYTLDINIPLVLSNKKNYIEFYLISNRAKVKLDINFAKPLSRLSNNRYSYWNIDKFTLNYRKNSILVLKRKKLRTIKREIKYIKYLLKSKNKQVRKCAYVRMLYFITKPFFIKKIWLFEDKIYKAGDNGEYLYTYAINKKDGIKKYYILSDKCDDAKDFKKQGKKFVKYGSIKHKLIFLNSDIVFETHNNLTVHHSFEQNIEKYFRDLYNSTNVCIQHGLTVQYIPHLTNRINDNLKQFFLASPIEKKNMLNKEYSYKGYEDILKITGSPRYDGLKNRDKKQILITPSWRNYLATPISSIDTTRVYNKSFVNSDYYKIYNALINNAKLIETANKTGYKIIYLLHPCTSPQINDFDKNDYVELIAATEQLNYEKILTESSLMVTDYSGVQFDFAYMYKPIVYFHPKELPPSYEEGEYKYETMALGEIVDNSERLVETICEYMNNECKIKDEYKERVDKFFKYHDYNNCERIYEEIMKKFYNK